MNKIIKSTNNEKQIGTNITKKINEENLINTNSLTKKRVCKEKLGYDFLNDYEDYKIVIIKSDTGTGKSTSIKHYIKNKGLKFISITSRKTMADEHFRIFNDFNIDCQHYKHSKLEENKSSISTIESMKKLIRFIPLKDLKDYVLVLDEINSLVFHIITSPTVTDRESLIEVMANLQNMIYHCKQVICVDATLTESVFKFLNFWASKKIYINNTYKNNQGIEAEEIDNLYGLIEEIKKHKKFMICCDEKNKAIELHKKLNDETIKLLVAEPNEKEYKELNLDDFDKVIFSPTIIYGLDAQMLRPVFCAYTCSTIDGFQMYQQLSRTRNIEKLYFYFYKKPIRTRNYKNIEDVMKEQNAIRDWLEASYELIGKNKIYDLIEELKVIEKFKQDEIKQNDYKFFVKLLKEKGFIVKANGNNKAENLKTDKELVNEYYQEIFNFEKNLINKFMKLDEETAKKNIKLLCDPYVLLKHLNLISYFIQHNESSIKYSLMSLVYDAFPDKVIKNKLYKMNLLNKILKFIGCDNKTIMIKDTNKDEEELARLFTDYKLIHPELKLKNKTIYGLMVVINHLIVELFPEKLFIKRKMRTDGTTEQQRTFKLVLNQDIYDYHKHLSTFRDIKIHSNFIDDDGDDDDSDEEIEKIL